ncbi:MAG: hypothetical protein HZB59_09420 [Ignavibacteriales bacterium]|nr:hypothetical protein [Ignavibacteriales bacterium]
MARITTKNIFFWIIISFLLSTCKKENGVNNPTDDSDNKSGLYGTGALSFESTDIDSGLRASGSYKPSNEFANDTASRGAGGFVKDSLLFGKKINGLITGYEHSIINSTLNERILLIALSDTTVGIRPGSYGFSYLNTTLHSPGAYVYFILTDSVNFFRMFVPKTGNLTITSYDAQTRHVIGNFTGILFSMPPDTSRQIQMTNGLFDIYLSDKYFNY